MAFEVLDLRHSLFSVVLILVLGYYFEGLRIQIQLNPQAPVAQKVADEVVFRRFGGEAVDFL